MVRPSGVTVLAALEIIRGAVFLLLGSGFLLLFAAPERLLADAAEDLMSEGITPDVLVWGGCIFLLVGSVSLVIAYGYLRGSRWAWTLGLVFVVLDILLAILGIDPFGILSITLNAIFIYYLTRSLARQFFGK